MSNKMVKKAYSLAIAAAVTASTLGGAVMSAVMPVMAEENKVAAVGEIPANKGVADFGQGDASIAIKGNEGQSMVGKKFEVFQLFNAENSKHNESINYTFNDKYKTALQTVVCAALNERDSVNLTPAEVTEYMVIDYIQTLNEHYVEGAQTPQTENGRYSDFRYFVEDVRDEIKKEGITGDIVSVKSMGNDNILRLTGLQYGYYVVDELSDKDSEGNEHFASSLCMVDTANPNAEINIKSDYPTIIKKVQEDDNNIGFNDVADYEIGQTVPFKYTSTIPNMYGYHTYYYAWHDSMDEELTFHNDKNEISITINKKDGKSYKLKDEEYNVITDKAAMDPEDTFKIEINDIKAIVDREFDNVDQDGNNDYTGLTVTLEYNATLNDLAANDAGRPGYENDVRLEFSNDPDSAGDGETGKTPWDTVVVFTFKVNGLKTNDHDFKLEGAKFRLYSDPECKNEVYVKPYKPVQHSDEATDEDAVAPARITGETGETHNVTNPSDEEHNAMGNNGYIVINRDSVGGDDHTGGTAPKDAVEMVSDVNGNFTIRGLDQGTYYLKETDAPDGYRPLLDPITITIKPTYTANRDDYVAGDGATDKTLTKLEATAHIKEFYDGQYKEGDENLNTDIEDGSADIKIINEVGAKLPITGSSAMLLMLGAGLSLAGGAVAVSRKKKGEEE